MKLCGNINTAVGVAGKRAKVTSRRRTGKEVQETRWIRRNLKMRDVGCEYVELTMGS